MKLLTNDRQLALFEKLCPIVRLFNHSAEVFGQASKVKIKFDILYEISYKWPSINVSLVEDLCLLGVLI